MKLYELMTESKSFGAAGLSRELKKSGVDLEAMNKRNIEFSKQLDIQREEIHMRRLQDLAKKYNLDLQDVIKTYSSLNKDLDKTREKIGSMYGQSSLKEIKQRLDPSCWPDKHKEGTKIKGGVRVNNCVPNEDIENGLSLDEQFDVIEEMVQHLAKEYGVDPEVIWEDFEAVDDTTLLETAAWKRKEGKNKKGGLNAKGVASYRKEHPGSKLQTAVTTKPSKLKPGSKAAKRRKSFCARMGGVKGPMKKPNGEPTRKALALRKWNCHESIENTIDEGWKSKLAGAALAGAAAFGSGHAQSADLGMNTAKSELQTRAISSKQVVSPGTPEQAKLDPRYKTDPAFRKEVDSAMQISVRENNQYQQGVAEGQGEQISKTKALNSLRKELMNSYEYMKCANLEEFKHRLQWLSEGMLKNHITHVVNYVINMKEIELYQEYREKREQIQRGLTKGVAEGLIMPGEGFKKNINEVEDIMMELRNKLKYNN